MTRHLALGEAGEEIAANYLRNKGLKIVDRRVRCGRGELDLVARDGKEWVFVEVKTRSTRRMGSAAEAFTPRKTGRMKKAVEEYVRLHDLYESAIRCDLVAIDFNEDGLPEITHFSGCLTWT